MNKIYRTLTTIVLLSIMVQISMAKEGIDNNNPATYKSFVDGYRGFSRVTDENGESPPYEDHTLSINVGDTVIWINNDVSNRLTIVSEQKLWKENDARLSYAGRKFNYIFNDAGTYTLHIKPDEKLPKQTIIVSDILAYVTPVPTDTVTPVPTTTPVPTDNATPVPTTTSASTDTGTSDTVPFPTDTETNDTIPFQTDTDTGVVTPVPNTTETYTVPVSNVTNVTNVTDAPIVSTTSVHPILAPLDIVNNLKMTGMITFVIIAIIFFIRE